MVFIITTNITHGSNISNKISEPMKCAGIYYLNTGAFPDNERQARSFIIDQQVASYIYKTHIAKKPINRGTIKRLKSEAMDWIGKIYDKYEGQKADDLPINMGIVKLTEIVMNCDRWVGKAGGLIKKLTKANASEDEATKILLSKVKFPERYTKFRDFGVKNIKLLVFYSKALIKGMDFWNQSGRLTPYKFQNQLRNKLENKK